MRTFYNPMPPTAQNGAYSHSNIWPAAELYASHSIKLGVPLKILCFQQHEFVCILMNVSG